MMSLTPRAESFRLSKENYLREVNERLDNDTWTCTILRDVVAIIISWNFFTDGCESEN